MSGRLIDQKNSKYQEWLESGFQTPNGMSANSQGKFKQTEIGMLPADWQTATLGKVTKLMTNGFVGTATRHYSENDRGVLYIQGYNVKENSFNLHGIKYVTEEFHKANMKSCLQAGDLLTIQTGDVGVTTIVPESLAGSNCHALIISRFDKNVAYPLFISYYLNSQSGRSRLKLIETGTTMKHLNVGDMLHFVVPLPPLPEQEAIAEAFADVDALLTALDKLIAKKRAIKQAAMQQLLTGKTRLPGFIGEWDQKRLGEVLHVRHGKSQRGVVTVDGKYPILASGGEIGRTDVYLYDKPSVLIGRKGTIDEPQFASSPFWTIDTLFYTEIDGSTDPKFLYYKFCMIDWRSYNEASGVPSLSAHTIEHIGIFLPEYNEQVAIASVLSDMDTEIAALEKRRDKTQQIKQGMMQQLLTGRIRLVNSSENES